MPTIPTFTNPEDFVNGQIYVMLCNDYQKMLGWFIKWFCKGNYCHAAIIRKPGFVCTQNGMYQEVPISNYLKNYEGLKFWTINNLTPGEFLAINSAISDDLQKPWYRRLYNYPGLIAQGFPWLKKWFSMPGQDICSQRVSEYLRLLPRLTIVVPEHPSPSDLDAIFIQNPNLFTCAGNWWQD